MAVLLHVLLVLCAAVQASFSARILGIFGHVGKSHFDAFQPLMEALASRGHHVVVLSHFPRKGPPLANYTDVSLVGSMTRLNSTAAVDIPRVVRFTEWQMSFMLSWFGARTCEEVLAYPPVEELLRSDLTFDLVFTELFDVDCFLGFARRFRAPHITLSSHVLMPWANGRVGNPDHPGYVRNLFSGAPEDMGLLDRMYNVAMLLFHKAVYRLTEAWDVQAIVERHFGAGTSLEELRANTSLVLVNTHYTVSGARPLVPGVVDVGGMHIRPPPPLPQDLEEFMSGAEHGLVYFSMGSMIKPETFPEDKLHAFLHAFSQLPQRVLWKWGADHLPGRPANVRTARWLPQVGVLQHAKTRAYISHCGNLGVLEAAQAGVPIVAIPLYGDQPYNARTLEARGMAVMLPYEDITADSVLRALRAVLEEPRYRESARRVSLAFKDRPLGALETAVYWTEHVVRHRGAPLLRCPAADLPWYRLLLVDVAAAFLLATGVLALLLWPLVVAIRRTAGKSKTD